MASEIKNPPQCPEIETTATALATATEMAVEETTSLLVPEDITPNYDEQDSAVTEKWHNTEDPQYGTPLQENPPPSLLESNDVEKPKKSPQLPEIDTKMGQETSTLLMHYDEDDKKSKIDTRVEQDTCTLLLKYDDDKKSTIDTRVEQETSTLLIHYDDDTMKPKIDTRVEQETSTLLLQYGENDEKSKHENDKDGESSTLESVVGLTQQTLGSRMNESTTTVALNATESASVSSRTEVAKNWFRYRLSLINKKWCVTAIIFSIIFATGITIFIVVSKTMGKGDGGVTDVVPTNAPTATAWGELTTRVKAGWDVNDTELESGGPYGKAMDWTVVDPLSNSWINEDGDTAMFDQRFGMALFYFQMGGDTWTNCSHQGMAPVENCTLYDRDGVVMGGKKWLSEDHECGWGGVICEADVVSGLHLNDLALNGTIPSSISKITTLKELYLMNNKISGHIPTEIGSLSKLLVIDFRSNSLEHGVPDELYKLSGLIDLTLAYNKLNGTMSPDIGNMTSLKVLHITGNTMTGSIPSEIGSIELDVLSISQNYFSGTLPVKFDRLTRLNTLFLDNNEFYGALQLPHAPRLMDLRVNDNSFSGNLPDNLFRLTNLRVLRANNNKFTGTLSPDIGNLSNLMYLNFRENDLKGTLPKEIAKLSNLETLQLHRNQFSGTVPSDVCELRELELANFHMDCHKSLEDLVDNTAAEVTCECCTQCCDNIGICYDV